MEEMVRIKDLLEKARRTDAYPTLKNVILPGLTKVDIVALAGELKRVREALSALREENIRLNRELERLRKQKGREGKVMRA